MKEIIIGILDIITTLALCKASSKADGKIEHL
jgi:hypothetical protein